MPVNIGVNIQRSPNRINQQLREAGVEGKFPKLLLDFKDQYYLASGGSKTLANAVTHARSGNAVMTDGYGPELVTNGDFSDGTTGWDTDGNPVVNRGVVTIPIDNGTTEYIEQTLSTVSGKTYIVSYDYIDADATGRGIRTSANDGTSGNFNGDLAAENITLADSNGNVELVFTATSSNSTVRIICNTGTNGAFVSIDNVSVREMPVLKWAPHNLFTYSEEFDNAAWSTLGINLTSVTTDLPTGASGTAYRVQDTDQGLLWQSLSLPVGIKHTVAVWAKRGGSVDNIFGLHIDGNLVSSQFTATSEWQLFEFEATIATGGSRSAGLIDFTGQVYDIIIWGAHIYRSDLGGMVDNPERGDSYVPTAVRLTGANLVTNGTFDTDSDWTKGTGWSIGSGVASVDGTQTAVSALAQTITVEAGSVYSFRVNIASIASGNLSLSYANGTGSVSPSAYITYTAIGQMERSFVATASGTVTFNISASSSCVGSVDNTIVRKSTVNPATAAYLPRIGHHVYNGSAWVNEGLLAESEARTNDLNYSQDFSDAYWTKNDTATLSLDSVGPDGQEDSAVKLIDDSSTGTSVSGVYLGRNVTVDTSSAYTFSVYAKKDQLDWVALLGTSFTTPAIVSCYFDLDNGVISSTNQSGLDEATIQDVGNGWYRCSITFTTDSTDTSGQVRVYVAEGSGAYQLDLDGTSSVLIYGAQFEKGSTPSSLIPTSGSSVTRAAETFTIPSANLPWPSPNYIGSELVTNGGFDTDSDWTLSTNVSISSGKLNFNATNTSFIGANQSVSFVSGKVYQISIDVDSVTSGEWQVFVARNSGDKIVIDGASTGSFSGTYVSDGTETNFYVARKGATTLVGVLDNVSVREINPLSVSIAMDGRISYTKSGSDAFWRWREDANTYINDVFFTDYKFISAQKDGTTYDQVDTTANYFSGDLLESYDIASRHGSTFINAAESGVALTANTTPTQLPDLSATDLDLAYDYMGTLATFRVWDRDIGDTGLVEATSPSLEPSLSLTFEGVGTNSFVVNDWSE